MSNKKDELNLKGPDAFQLKAAESVEFARKNSSKLYTILGVAALLAVGAFAYQKFSSSKSVERQSELSVIDTAREKSVQVHQDKRAELEKQIDVLKLAQKENKEYDAGKLASLEKSLSDMGEEPDYSSFATQYQKYYEANSSTPEGWVAGLRFATQLSKDKKLEEAKKVVADIFTRSSGYSLLHHQSGMVLISIYEDLKLFEDAVKVADSMLASSGEGLKPQYLLAKARGLYLLNKKDEAGKVTDEILEKYETSQESEKARGLKALIN